MPQFLSTSVSPTTYATAQQAHALRMHMESELVEHDWQPESIIMVPTQPGALVGTMICTWSGGIVHAWNPDGGRVSTQRIARAYMGLEKYRDPTAPDERRHR